MMAPNFRGSQARIRYTPATMKERNEEPSRQDREPQQPEQPQQSLSLWQIVSSTIAAAFGVQSSRNRERDFTRGRAIHFIIAGIVFTVLFVFALVVVVNLVL